MPYVDEKLLEKLVDKYGIERQAANTVKSALWGKVTREYNTITGNNHTKARLGKKWQNMNYQKKVKCISSKVSSVSDGGSDQVISALFPSSPSKDQDQATTKDTLSDGSDNIWATQDHALRDLFLYLVQKYKVDEVTNPKVKNELWKQIASEFHRACGHIVYLKHGKFTKKWQNWKQYNKSRGKPHPFEMCNNLDIDVIKEKLSKLIERAAKDPNLAAAFFRESGDCCHKIRLPTSDSAQPIKLTEPDSSSVEFAGAASVSPKYSRRQIKEPTAHVPVIVSSSTTSRQIEREIFLETLRCEQERFRIIQENGCLERNKLLKETQIIDMQIQLVQAELALKREQCKMNGIDLA